MNNYSETRHLLLKDGWSYDHTASVAIYRPSGTISKMKSTVSHDFCRLHIGKVIMKNGHAYQITYVYKREKLL